MNFEATYAGTAFGGRGGNLYNGNIRHVALAIGGMPVHGNAYNYDQLQRIKRADVYSGINTTTNTWSGATLQSDYKARYSYDANGNITSLTRQGKGTAMDDLTYNYYSGNNRLEYVDDPVSSGNYDFDIDDQSSGNYTYWENGALKSDLHDEIALIEWTVDRKVKTITRTTGSTLPDLEFWYDAMGRRLVKIEKPRPGGNPSAANLWIYTGYQHDAGGNVMAIYGFEVSGTTQTITLKEQNIYGAGRLGVVNRNKQIASYNFFTTTLTLANHDDTTRVLGHKTFEFTGHTGNVHLTTTDRTIPVDDGDGTIYTFLPDVQSTADFYPFGMQKPGRFSNSDGYRYAFHGMETDGEKTGNHGGSYTTEFRQYDPRVGRWLSLDPLMAKFPHMSPYVAFDNNPIYYIDPYGLESTNGEPENGTTRKNDKGETEMFWDGTWTAAGSGEGEIKGERVKIAGDVEIEIALNQQNGARDNRYNEARTSTFTHALKSMENIAFKKALKKAAEKAGSRRLADAIGELFVGFTPRDLENITPVDGYNMIAEELIEARMATSTNGSLSLKGHILIALTSIAFEFMVHHMLSEFERSQAAFEDYQFLKSKDWKVLGKLIQNKVITRKTGKTFMGSGGGKTPIFVYSNADIYNGVISKVVPTPYYIENEQQAMKLLGFVPTVVYIGFTEHYDSENNLFYYQNKVPFK